MSWWYRSALCGHPLPASANNWTRGLQLADIPPPRSATLGLHPIARKLLFISRPAEGRRLSWPLGPESNALTTEPPSHRKLAVGCDNDDPSTAHHVMNISGVSHVADCTVSKTRSVYCGGDWSLVKQSAQWWTRRDTIQRSGQRAVPRWRRSVLQSLSAGACDDVAVFSHGQPITICHGWCW